MFPCDPGLGRPILTSFICGILIGIGLLVLLPEGADELKDRFGWPMRHVLLLFIGSASSLFLLEHCLLGHEHAPPSDLQLAALDAAAIAPTAAPEPSSSCTTIQCEPCEEGVGTFAISTKQRRSRKLKLVTDRNTKSVVGIALSGQVTCECCEESGRILEQNGAHHGQLGLALCPGGPRVLAVLKVASETVRLLAWMVHIFMDGIALGCCNSAGTLLPLALSMLVCTLQDTSAFCACLRRVSQLYSLVALFAFSITFSLGVVVSLWMVHRAGASPEALAVARIVMAAFFLYMAIFEMSPPHTHARLHNLSFLLAFVCGASIAASTDLLEGVFSGGGKLR